MIRKALMSDYDDILEIFMIARKFMKANNNEQWGDTYPPVDDVKKDIQKGNFYLYIVENKTQAVFSYYHGNCEYFNTIKGKWLNNDTYTTFSRIASRGEVKGVTEKCVNWILKETKNIRVDTHPDNIQMQKALEKLGFKCCGKVILARNNAEHLAYEKNI